MVPKVVVVTGANKGIGYQIVLELLRTTTEPLTVYLTARQPSLGEAAVEEIKASDIVSKSKSELLFHQLDITSSSSVDAFASYLKEKHGKIHVLINNAGIGTPRGLPFAEQVAKCFDCNYYGTARVTKALLPLIDPTEGRIDNVSSQALPSSKIESESLREELKSPTLTYAALEALAQKLQKTAEEGGEEAFKSNGWPVTAYGISKTFMSALTMITAREHPELLVNACSPGWVKTDLAPDGPGTAEEGAVCPTFVAIGDIKGATGKYYSKDKVIIDW